MIAVIVNAVLNTIYRIRYALGHGHVCEYTYRGIYIGTCRKPGLHRGRE